MLLARTLSHVEAVQTIDARLVLNPPPDANMKALCQALMDVLWDMAMFTHLRKDAMCQFGLTKVFLRKQMIQSLDALRELKLQDMDKAAVLIQARCVSSLRIFGSLQCIRGAATRTTI